MIYHSKIIALPCGLPVYLQFQKKELVGVEPTNLVKLIRKSSIATTFTIFCMFINPLTYVRFFWIARNVVTLKTASKAKASAEQGSHDHTAQLLFS